LARGLRGEVKSEHMHGFYWLIEGELAGCSRPGGAARPLWGPGEAVSGAALAADLTWLRERGIGALLTLTETPLPTAALARHGLESLHLPVDDLTAPSPEQLDRALAFIDRQRASGRAVAVHCKVGQGRTGCVLAAYLIRSGATSEDALRHLRAVCPGAVGAPEQEQALRAFAERRDWII
jgi:atypical dual specificity phosphatase